MKVKGWQTLFSLQGEPFQGMLPTIINMLLLFIEEDELVEITIENEIKFLLSYNKHMELELFLKTFKKYAKSKRFFEITEKLCTIFQDE